MLIYLQHMLMFSARDMLKYMNTNSVMANILIHYSTETKLTHMASNVTSADGRVHTK